MEGRRGGGKKKVAMLASYLSREMKVGVRTRRRRGQAVVVLADGADVAVGLAAARAGGELVSHERGVALPEVECPGLRFVEASEGLVGAVKVEAEERAAGNAQDERCLCGELAVDGADDVCRAGLVDGGGEDRGRGAKSEEREVSEHL